MLHAENSKDDQWNSCDFLSELQNQLEQWFLLNTNWNQTVYQSENQYGNCQSVICKEYQLQNRSFNDKYIESNQIKQQHK